MTDYLEQALRDLQFEAPARLVERAVAAANRDTVIARRGVKPRHFRRGLERVFAIAALIVVANFGAAYFAPVYEETLADALVVGGIAGPILRYSGLDPTHITLADQTATSSGHTIKLVGGYADTERTVFVVEVDGQAHHLPSKQETCCSVIGSVTDQFGHRYHQVNGADSLAPTFEPLVWPATSVGARLTLHIEMLSDTKITNGDWELHLTLMQQKGVALPVPSSITANGITYTFDSLHLSGMQLSVRYHLSGPQVDQIRKRVYSGDSSAMSSFTQSFAGPHLVDASGNEVRLIEWGITLLKDGPAQGVYSAVLPGPGRYVLTIGTAAGAPKVEMQIP